MEKSNHLFRESAIKKQSARLDGEVAIAQPLPSKVLLFALLSVICITLVYLANASFHRKETVVGYLSPNAGTSKIISPTSGVISEFMVASGERVEKGQPIALIIMPQLTADGASLVSEVYSSIKTQMSLLDKRINKTISAHQQKIASTNDAIAFSQQSLAQTQAQITHATDRLRIQTQRYENLLRLFGDGAIARIDVDTQEEQVILLKQQVAELSVREQQQANEFNRLQQQLRILPTEHSQSIALLESEKARLSQQLTRNQASGELLITAPNEGVVTNIALSTGASVRQQQYLMTIMPQDSQLKAVLLVPSRAYGFVEAGQSTKLRFDAFPYQRFGLFDGEVTYTSRYIVLPGEVEMPVNIDTPVYQVEVQMASQQISAYGQSVPLQPGMTISADIVLEERSLLSWLFEPIISLKGRV